MGLVRLLISRKSRSSIIGGADILPQLFGEGVVVEAVIEILLQTPHCPLFLHLPLLFPRPELLYSLLPAGSIEDAFGFGHTGLQVYPLKLDSHIPQLVDNTPLYLEEGINLLECLQQGWISINGNELEDFALKSSALQIHQEDPLKTRRAEFHGLCPWVNENSPVGRQAKLVF